MTEMQQQLVTDNVKLVYFFANRLNDTAFVSRNKDDLVSEGMVGLVKAAKAFDGTKGIKFATFASRCINNQMLMFIRRNRKHEGVLSLYESICGDFEGNENLLLDAIADKNSEIDKAIEALDAMTCLEELMTVLTSKERRIIECMKMDLSQREIAKKVGTTQSYTSRLVCKIRKKYRSMIERCCGG